MRTLTRCAGVLASAGWLIGGWSSAAQAQTAIVIDAQVVPSCIMTATSGVATMSAGGSELGTEQPMGTAATLSVTASGGTPTLVFTAPTLSAKPANYLRAPTVSLKYSSPGGASQAYTTGSSQYTSTNPLGDTVTLHAKAVDTAGFIAGSYRIQATATCQQ